MGVVFHVEHLSCLFLWLAMVMVNGEVGWRVVVILFCLDKLYLLPK